MSVPVAVVCRPEVSAGFRLTGIPTFEAAGAPEAAEWVRQGLAEASTGIVLIEEPLYRDLPADLRRALGRRSLPMLVPFPGPVWRPEAESAEAYIVELLRQVVGYRVRLT